MSNKTTIMDPEKRLKVTKRYLHALALLQGGGRDPIDWNCTSLADVISLDENKNLKIADASVLKYIRENLIDELGLNIYVERGSRRIALTEPLDIDVVKKVANIYSSFVVKDAAKEIILNNFIKKHPYDSLWILARIYFAILAKRRITFDYSPDGSHVYQNKVNPFHLVFRNNNLYLVCRLLYNKQVLPLIVNKLDNLVILDEQFDEEIPPIEEIYKDTLGSFIGKKYRVKIKFSSDIYSTMYDLLGILDPEYTEIDDGKYFEAEFDLSDDRYLCMQLFLHGNKVEIIDPPELRRTMLEMLKESLELYDR